MSSTSPDHPLSKSSDDKLIGAKQIALSLFAVAASMMTGVYVTVRREKIKMKNVVSAGTPAIVASKALLYGSAYSIGSFFLGTSAIVMFTGVSSFQEFGEYVDKNFRTEEGYRRVLEKRERERQQLEAMSVKYAHLGKYDLLWKQLRANEELENDEDEEDEEIIGSPEALERRRLERDGAEARARAADPEHYNVVLVALQNLKKVTANIGYRLFNIPIEPEPARQGSYTEAVAVSDSPHTPAVVKQSSKFEEDTSQNLLVRKWNKLLSILATDTAGGASGGDRAPSSPSEASSSSQETK